MKCQFVALWLVAFTGFIDLASGRASYDTQPDSAASLRAGRSLQPEAHIAALPVVKALPWVSKSPAPPNSTDSLAAVVDFSAKKTEAAAANPEVIAKFTGSAEASAARAQEHLEKAKKALETTQSNAKKIEKTGKKIEKTAGTIKYLYSTPEPPPAPTTEAPAEKSAAYSLRTFGVAASLVACSVVGLVN